MIEQIKNTDIYLLDQIFKGTYKIGDCILDAGCGHGRNMVWFIQNNFDIYGCDSAEDAVNFAHINTGISTEKLRCATVENMPYLSNQFDHVICSAVLHFARDTAHFIGMINEIDRVLKPGGILFIRMTSDFGLPKNYSELGSGRYLLQDGSQRFLLTKDLLESIKTKFGFQQIEPVKSTLVEELRSMTTLVLRKTK